MCSHGVAVFVVSISLHHIHEAAASLAVTVTVEMDVGAIASAMCDGFLN